MSEKEVGGAKMCEKASATMEKELCKLKCEEVRRIIRIINNALPIVEMHTIYLQMSHITLQQRRRR